MAVKILIQRKIRPGKENEFGKALRELRSQAIHAQGYISGETLLAVGDPSLHLVISTWNQSRRLASLGKLRGTESLPG